MTSPDDYRFLADLLKRNSGLHLGEGKEYLLESRLLPIAEQFGLKDVADLVRAIREGATPQLALATVEAMTTQETLFFRDMTPFKALKENLLPEALPRRRALHQKVRIWSAACSTGQEPYSIAMLLAEASDRSHHVLATDIDGIALAHARAAGPYTEKEIKNVSRLRREEQLRQDEEGRWWVTDQIRSMVTFQQHDLLQDPMPAGFDLIACRNVLIYFTPEARARLFARFAETLRIGGVLFVGATEAVSVTQVIGLRPISFGFYVREDERSHR